MLRHRYGVTSYEERLRESSRRQPNVAIVLDADARPLSIALEHERKWRGQPEHAIRGEMERAVHRRLARSNRGR